MMKMSTSTQVSLFSMYSLLLISTIFTLSRGMNLPHQGNTGFTVDSSLEQDSNINTGGLRHLLQRRTCDGFPCMYSHLGTKAGRASLYKTLASFIDECFTDPECDPGRRKRTDHSSNIRKLINTPAIDLVRWRMNKDQ